MVSRPAILCRKEGCFIGLILYPEIVQLLYHSGFQPMETLKIGYFPSPFVDFTYPHWLFPQHCHPKPVEGLSKSKLHITIFAIRCPITNPLYTALLPLAISSYADSFLPPGLPASPLLKNSFT